MKKLFAWLLAALAALAYLPASAEDIDLFASPPTTVTYLPNVLIIVDNTANWETAFDQEKSALKATFDSLPLDKFRVGIMMYTETGGGNGNPGGAYVRAAIRTMNSANRPAYAAWIDSWDKQGDKGNARSLGLAMAEAYNYFAGGTPYAGGNKVKRDYAGNSIPTTGNAASSSANSNAIYALAGNALASSTATSYTSPVQDGCQRNFIIYIGNTTSQGNVTSDNSNENDAAKTLLSSAGGDTSAVTNISPAGMSDNISNEWTRFMRYSSYNITTYTVDVSFGNNGQGPDNSALLKSMALEGSGKYFRIEASTSTTLQQDIEKALGQIFSEIQSVNSVFASVSLPVSVNTQGSYLNQVYIGMFRPDIGAKPRWSGNLKQFKLGLVGSELKLLDARSTTTTASSAINAKTGFITECARSYWTQSAVETNGYWAFMSWPVGTTFCLDPGATELQYRNSDSPDGNIVEKGAAAYKLRSTTTRKMYTWSCSNNLNTCSQGSSTMVAFNNSNVTAAALGVGTDALRDTVVNWALGLDSDDEDIDGVTATTTTKEMRPSAHGDVVHSRPVAVNFEDSATTAATSKVVVFYGGNDGVLRAINGNRGDTSTGLIGSFEPGRELWSFMPPESYTNLNRLRVNEQLVQLAGETYDDSVTTGPKPYGMDGPITAFKGLVNDVSKTYIYATMRRGGRSIYAFDVTNMMTTPDSPTFKWRIGCSDPSSTATADCTSGLTRIGQTWASPKAFTTEGYKKNSKVAPLIIFGGGYDTCEDYDALGAGGANNNCTSSSKGGAVYVVDADTGEVVRTFETGFNRGVVADVTLVRDATGNVILGYTADLGGNVYRIKFGTGDLDKNGWSMTRIASLGCATIDTCTANRKFMFAPSVATTDVISMNAEYIVLLGSGDREKPVGYYASAGAVQNHFFQFTDKPAVSSATWPGNGCGAEIICLNSLFGVSSTSTTNPTSGDLAGKKGWYLQLQSSEQVVTAAVTVFGVVTFSSHTPAGVTGTCSANLGATRVYNINYSNAGKLDGEKDRFSDVAGDGLPPSPVAGQVTLDDGTTVPFCIGCSPDSPLEGRLPASLSYSTKPKGRLYWYIEK